MNRKEIISIVLTLVLFKSCQNAQINVTPTLVVQNGTTNAPWVINNYKNPNQFLFVKFWDGIHEYDFTTDTVTQLSPIDIRGTLLVPLPSTNFEEYTNVRQDRNIVIWNASTSSRVADQNLITFPCYLIVL